MATKLGKIGMRTLAGTLVATGPVIAACSTGPTFDQWAATDGAAGRINLDDVQVAFKKSESATQFERRVNEIYEGDGVVLIRVKEKEGGGQVMEGWEDLSRPLNHRIDDATDDLLFSITNENENNELRGHGGNGYYRSGFGGGNFLFTYLLISSLGPRGYYYSTPPLSSRRSAQTRNNYRGTSAYRSQVSRNSKYFSGRKTGVAASSRNLSTSRQTYQSRSSRSGAFRTSATGVRSSWGSSASRSGGFSRGGRGGGFRGFGGGQVIIGMTRR